MNIQYIVRYILVFISLMLGVAAAAQVTTGGINGIVRDNKGEPLAGAAIAAVHVPSGTKYYTLAQANGNYMLQGVRVGQEYSLEISFMGFSTKKIDHITVSLGDAVRIDATLDETTTQLSEVVVAATTSEKTGTATNITNRQIQELPSINRSINDFTKLIPQANGDNSFAGRDSRYNYITIDGSAFNNSFGLNGKNLPGGEAQPISLDAIDQIAVNIAPFDIRQSNFTGAGINAVTKSGNNTFGGSVYTYLRPTSFAGKTISGTRYDWDETAKQTYGISLSGPIVKNKLFIFVNGEYEKADAPSTSWKASENGNADPEQYISRAQIATLAGLKEHLRSTYNYDAGDWNWKPLGSENYKILARVDWNINQTHKLTVRYNQVVSTNDLLPSTSSVPSGVPRSRFGRISEKSMAFTHAGYGFENTVRSVTAELNSMWTAKFANKLLTTYTQIRDRRTSPSEAFPFVDIWEGGDPYTSFGYELYSYNTDLKNNTFSVIDNFSIYLSDHTLTAGLAYEQMYFGNAYMMFGNGYYRYNSVDAFLNDEAPAVYAMTYGLNGQTTPYSELSFGVGAFYLQDEWQVLHNLKLTGGIRFELPLYLNNLQPNQPIADLTFGGGYKMDMGAWPKQQLLISPRVAFNWDVRGDGQYKIRGGTGIFTGRIPFVWFVNQPTNAGNLQYTKILTNAAVPADMRFNPNIYGQIDQYPHLFSNPTSASSMPVEVRKNFNMPQVWRTSLAADIKLPAGFTFTVEGLYTKDMNAVLLENVNEALPNATFSGSDNRPRYDGIPYRINSDISSAMVLGNTNKGYQYSITAQLVKEFDRGFSGMVAYTFSEAKDMTNSPGDQAASIWSSNVAVGSLNDPGLSYSAFSVPHRIIAALSQRFSYAKSFLATTVSLFYEGAPQGRLNYIYSNDMNGDGNSSDLMYIPKDENDITFVPKNGMTAKEQSDAFFKFLEQDDYLLTHKGEYAQRFGAVMPWAHRFNVKLTQDFILNRARQTKIQLTLDVLNLGNLLNSSWGVSSAQIVGTNNNAPLLAYAGVDATTNRPTFTLPVDNLADYYTATYKNVLSYASTWSMQLGVRFVF
jgi:outer membrane receptor for ferrienterochelin and colicin